MATDEGPRSTEREPNPPSLHSAATSAQEDGTPPDAAARTSEELHRRIVESAREYAIFTIDDDGVIDSWSPGAAAVLGWPAEEAIGHDVAMTFTPEDRQRGEHLKERATAREEGAAPDVRWHLRRDGTLAFIDGVLRLIELGDGTRRFVKIGRDVTERRRAEDEARELNQSLEQRVADRTAELQQEVAERERAESGLREVLRKLVSAEEEERRRISLELHDQMGQHLTGLLLGLRAARIEAGSPSLRARIADLEHLATNIAAEMQTMAVELRPPALDTLGLVAALGNHLEEWSGRHGIDCDVEARGIDGARLPSEIEATIYRIVQEGLTNVAKHADARRVGLVLELRDGTLRLILDDDGRGFDVDALLSSPEKARRLGVRGMRERVALLGGEFELESSPGRGTTLYVRVPLPETAG